MSSLNKPSTSSHADIQSSLIETKIESSKRTDYISWDDYFMALAVLSAKRSKDPVTQVGACIVNDENRIISIGYNGMPYQCSDDEFPWHKGADCPNNTNEHDNALNNDNKNLYVVHAEANAILNKNSISVKGARLYTTLFPCNECTKLILQSRIGKVIYLSDAKATKLKYRASKKMLNAAGIEYELYKPVNDYIPIDFKLFTSDKPIMSP